MPGKRHFRLMEEGLHTALCCQRAHARVRRLTFATATAPEAARTAPLHNLFAGFDQDLGGLRQGQSVAAET